LLDVDLVHAGKLQTGKAASAEKERTAEQKAQAIAAIDTLRINSQLWGGVATDADAVVASHARISAGDVVIDLGQGHSVRLDGVSSLSGLADQIILI
jgi:hypothetical protein